MQVLNNSWTDIDPKKYHGSDKVFEVLGGTIDLVINSNTVTGTNIGSILYFDGGEKSLPVPPAEINQNLRFTNNHFPVSSYGVFGSNSRTGENKSTGVPFSFSNHVQNGTYSGNSRPMYEAHLR